VAAMTDTDHKTGNELEDECSIVIPICERWDDVTSVYETYAAALKDDGYNFHFYYVLDGDYPEISETLQQLIAEGNPITIIQLARWFGEATALTVGFDACKGERILTLPPYVQVEAKEVIKLITALKHCDVAVARRIRDSDTIFNRIQSNVFNWMVSKLTGETFHDLGCSARALRRQVARELQLYGDQHRFLPLLASHRGYRVQEIPCQQAVSDQRTRLYKPGVYLRRMLDILSAFFLTKFTKKPLRFFGLVGSLIFVSGAALMIVLAVQRLGFGMALGDRPMLLLAALLLVLGIQVFAIGLIGEIVIFTHAKDMKEYNIEIIVRGTDSDPVARPEDRTVPDAPKAGVNHRSGP
jgi:glycosyltransferase involved in cell wall biosynthesis